MNGVNGAGNARTAAAVGRDALLTRTLLTGAGVQVVQVLGTLISLPFAARALTTDEFGVLATFTGFVALLGFADLGVGAGLTKRLVEDDVRGSPERVREAVASAGLAVFAPATLVLVSGAVAAMLVPWRSVLGTESVSNEVLTEAALAAAAATATSIVASLGQRILYGVQRGDDGNRWIAAGLIAGTAGTAAAALLDLPLFAFVLAGLGMPAIVGIACSAWSVRTVAGISLLTVRSYARRAEIRRLVIPSVWFFVIAVASTLAYQTDTLVVAAVVGASAAGVYSVVLRVFGVLIQAATPAAVQLWPAFAHAIAEGDLSWVRSRLRRAILWGGIGGGLMCALIVGVARPVISVWLDPALRPSWSLLVAMGAWTSYTLATLPIFYTLNAFGRVRAHALMAASVSVLNLPLSIVLAQRLGVEGPVIASMISHAFAAGLPGALLCARLIRRPAR